MNTCRVEIAISCTKVRTIVCVQVVPPSILCFFVPLVGFPLLSVKVTVLDTCVRYAFTLADGDDTAVLTPGCTLWMLVGMREDEKKTKSLEDGGLTMVAKSAEQRAS